LKEPPLTTACSPILKEAQSDSDDDHIQNTPSGEEYHQPETYDIAPDNMSDLTSINSGQFLCILVTNVTNNIVMVFVCFFTGAAVVSSGGVGAAGFSVVPGEHTVYFK